MPPPPVDSLDEVMANAEHPRKHTASPTDDLRVAKRTRTSSFLSPPTAGTDPADYKAVKYPTSAELARAGLRRSITLALDQVGFDSASEEAMESFSSIVETYLASVIAEIKTFANAARRAYPIPTDFEITLKRFNLTTSALKPHLRPPVPKSKRKPTWETLPIAQNVDADLPVLGPELSGQPEKEAKLHIPTIFPPFPSVHTYKSTPLVREYSPPNEDWGQFETDLPSQSVAPQSQTQAGSQTQTQTQVSHRPLAPDEIPRGDPKKMREAAAKEAKYGEEALRRLLRASKIAKQKEVWSTAQRDPPRKLRYELWESSMRDLIEEEARVQSSETDPGAIHGAAGRFEIADHSTIVNSETAFHRKEVQRSGARRPLTSGDAGLAKG